MLGSGTAYSYGHWPALLWFWANAALGMIFLSLLVIPHELGHALTAKLLGMRVFKIVLGTGKPFWQKKWLGVLWEFGSVPWGGATYIGQGRKDFYRLNFFMVGLSGPLVDFLPFLTGWHFVPI